MSRSKLLLIYVILFIIKCYNCSAQEIFSNQWFIGIKIQVIHFETFPPYSKLLDSFPLDTNTIVKGNANICDSNGNLLLATDGIKLYNAEGEYIDGGGENINNDSLTWEYGYDYPASNGNIVLPKKDNQFYIFSSTMSDAKCNYFFHSGTNDTFDFDEVRYSIVDMSANGGKGKIIEKNKLLLHSDAYPWVNKTNFTACRHANGRDWWLLKPSARMRQVLYKFLVTPDTIFTFVEQRPLLFNTWAYDNRGQSAFSMDGTQYAECNQYGPHTIYDFDRCSGELSLKRVINLLPFRDTFGNWIDGSQPTWSGLCYSPNGRFLYTSDFWNVYQIDLWNTNDTTAIVRVSKDTSYTPTPWGHPNYEGMQLTPTGVIYLGNRHGVSPFVNAITDPDSLGGACGFLFKYFKTDSINGIEIGNVNNPPNLPFYGLGKLEGSPCDTLKSYTEPPPTASAEIIVPNAFSPNGDGKNDTWHILNVPQLQLAGITIQAVGVYNRWGNEVFKNSDINFSWDAKGWASDSYYYYIRYKTKEGASKVQKGSVSVVR